MAERTYSTPEIERLNKRADLIKNGVDPYPAKMADNLTTLASVRERFSDLSPDTITDTEVAVAGRVMFKRGSGKIAFATLQEGDGTRLQVMMTAQDLGVDIYRDVVTELPLGHDTDAEIITLGKADIKKFDKVVDLGDFVEISGVVATSIKGELSVRAHSWRIVSKGITPLPFLHSELSDEMRVRQPYMNLIVSEDARRVVRDRAKIVRTIRRHFEDDDYIEIDVPILQPQHGGALARPFKTHVNALDQEFSLRIALELPLKKAVVGGIERVFSLGAVFRNEGIDSTHSPEFNMLEAYEAYGDMHSMARHTEQIFSSVCRAVHGVTTLDVDGTEIEFGGSYRWVSVYEGISEIVGAEITPDTSLSALQGIARDYDVSIDSEWSAGKVVMELCSELLEPTLVQPTFLHDWPAEAQPLARRQDEDSRKILAWDLIVSGMEVATAFTELVDPVVQREVLTAQSLAAANGDVEAMSLDEDFLQALMYGMTPTGGMGLGVDRLVMLMTGTNIRQAILFPLVRREDS